MSRLVWDLPGCKPPETGLLLARLIIEPAHEIMALFALSRVILQIGLDGLMFGRTLRLRPYFMGANSEGSGETVRMRRLAWAFAVRLCDKYHNRWLNYCTFQQSLIATLRKTTKIFLSQTLCRCSVCLWGLLLSVGRQRLSIPFQCSQHLYSLDYVGIR